MNINTNIPRELQERVNRELESGERIEWIDMPIPRFFTYSSTTAFLFAIPWTAFAIFWICAAANFKIPQFHEGGALLFPLFGVPFVLIGLGMFLSPLWTYRKTLNTVYVITSKRALTFCGGLSMTIRSYPPAKLQNLYRKEKGDGIGDIIIEVLSWGTAWGDSGNDPRIEELGFLGIKNLREVERKLRKLAAQDPAQD